VGGYCRNRQADKDLYNSVVEHRRIFTGLKGFDYATLAPKMINIVPPDNIIDLWKTDYEIMQRTMIYGESLPFSKLLDKIKQLNEKINQLEPGKVTKILAVIPHSPLLL
jgi:hypothetical protein